MHRFNVYIPDALMAALRTHAEEKRVRISKLINDYVELGLKNETETATQSAKKSEKLDEYMHESIIQTRYFTKEIYHLLTKKSVEEIQEIDAKCAQKRQALLAETD